MRVLIIKQLFNPEPTAKSLDFARELKAKGHQVEVLTGFPSYPKGKIYDGYTQKFWQIDYMEGIKVVRVPIFPDHSSSAFRRFLHYISYSITASTIGPFVVNKPDVAFVYQGAIPVGIPAFIFKKFLNVPFVYDINDLWPETVKTSGMLKSDFLLGLIEKWCQFNYRQADFITVCTPGFKEKLIEKGVPDNKIEFVSNWSRDKITSETIDISQKKKLFPPDRFNVMYAGNLGIVQNLKTVIDSALQLQRSDKPLAKFINFIFLGDGAAKKELTKYAEGKRVTNVTFLPRVKSEEVSKYLNSADALLVHLKRSSLFEITIPSKILAYLKTGKPILMGLKGNAVEILESAKGGLTFLPEDSDDLCDKILKLASKSEHQLSEMGKSGKKYYDNNLSIKSSTDKIEHHLLRIQQ